MPIPTEFQQLKGPDLKKKEGYVKTMTPAKKHPTKGTAKKRSTKPAAKNQPTTAAASTHHAAPHPPTERDFDLRLFTGMEQLMEVLQPLLQEAIKASEEAKHDPLKVVTPYHNITYCRH